MGSAGPGQCCGRPLRGGFALGGREGTEFGADFAVNRVLSQFPQIRIAAEPFQVAIAEIESVIQRIGGLLELAGERVAAGEIVMSHRIFRTMLDEPLVDAQTVLEAAAFRVVIAEQAQGVHVSGVTAHQTLEKRNFDIEVAAPLAVAGGMVGRGGLGHGTDAENVVANRRGVKRPAGECLNAAPLWPVETCVPCSQTARAQPSAHLVMKHLDQKRTESIDRTPHTSLRSLLSLVVAVAALVLVGCSAKTHKQWADNQVKGIIATGETNVFGKSTDFTIDTPWSARRPDEVLAAEILADRSQVATNEFSIEDAIKVGVANSRAYQTQKEDLYLAALGLTREQYNFWPIPFMGTTAGVNRNSDKSASYSFDSRVGVDQFLKTGGRLTMTLFNDVVTYFAGGRPDSAVSQMSVNFVQPLMRGAGAAVVGENLLQAERDVIYEIRDFSRFQDVFYVDVVVRYLRLLQNQDVLRNEWRNYQASVTSRDRSEASSDRVPRVQIDQARQKELTDRNRYLAAIVAYRNALDAFKELLGIPLTLDIRLQRTPIDDLKSIGLEPLQISEDEAFRIAVQRRLDVLNEIDQFEDSKRKIKVAANLLKAQLDVFGNVDVDSDLPDDYTKFDWENYRASAGVRLNLPIDRLRERNVYRTTFINFERQLRNLGLTLDNLRSTIRETLRQLELVRATYEIQKRSMDLADARVESAELLMQAGRIQIRDLLEAQNDQVRARNAFTVALIDYYAARMGFLRDIGVIDINQPKFWTQAQLPKLNDPVPPSTLPSKPDEKPMSPEQVLGMR